MPYINVNTSVKLSDEKKKELKIELGKIITFIPGKTEKALMIGICDNYEFYMSGEKKEKAAYVEVKLYGTAKKEAKETVTASLFLLFEELFGIGNDSLYITFSEHMEWGTGGLLK